MLGIDQSPWSLEVVTRAAPVPLLIRVMVAPGMVAPVEAVTLPAMSELELAWPKAAGVRTLSAATGTAAIKQASTACRARPVEKTELPIPYRFIFFLVNIGVASQIVVTSYSRPSFHRRSAKVFTLEIGLGGTSAAHLKVAK